MTDSIAKLSAALADRYRIDRELGAGGMATVYRAHDLKHDRDVAIKVLHEDLGATLGPERFLAEIKTTAKLQHPHILPLLDSGASGGLLYYVMPYVAGETLRDRLTRETQLPIEDAVRIAREVADALAHAHGHGIIHRDIKPENILLQGGHAVVADFGIALAVQHAGGGRLTQTGLSLGTPQYMAPEQAMGEKTVDHHADIYALGAVTYEMLTGEPPFTGANVQAIVAKVLSSEPAPITTTRKLVPVHVEEAVLKALAKLPADRWTGASQFADALGATAAQPAASAGKVHARRAREAMHGQGRAVWWARLAVAATVLATAAVSMAWWAIRRVADAPLPQQYDVVLPDSAPIVFAKGSPWGEGWTALAVSPRGNFVVYVADRGSRTELWYRSLLDSTARPLPGTEAAYQLALDSDGSSVAFIAGNRLKLASLAGGSVRELGEVRRPMGITWVAPDRLIVTDNDGGVTEFDRVGGSARSVAQVLCAIPFAMSPREVMCGSVGTGASEVDLLSLQDGTRRPIHLLDRAGDSSESSLRGSMPVLVGSRHLVFSAPDGSVIAARWYPDALAIDGRALVLSGVRTESVFGARQAVVSPSGTLVFVPGVNNGVGTLVLASGVGEAVPLRIEPVQAGQFDVSPDGKRLALTKFTLEGMELWIHDMASGRGEKWLAGRMFFEPRWSPDGRQLAVWAGLPTGSEGVTLIGTPTPGSAPDTVRGTAFTPSHWYAPDRMLGTVNSRIVRVQLGSRVVVDTVPSAQKGQRAVVSSDRRLVAYMSADEIVVQTFPDGRLRSTVGRGLDPLWLDRRTIVYKDRDKWYRIRVSDDASLTESPQPWFSDGRFIDTNSRSHALTPAGELIYLRSIAKESSTYLRVMPRWDARVVTVVKAALRR